jgi:hypothetical protein
MSDHVLAPGDRLRWNGQLYRCIRAGDCNATIAPEGYKQVSIVERRTGEVKTINRKDPAVQVSTVVGRSLVVGR